MARIRSIKPEFWTSEQVMECSPNARLAFIGMWNFCDDAGRMPASPKQIKALVFPSDDFTSENVRRMLDELERNGLIARYIVDDKEFLAVTGWHHQKIDRPQKPKTPEPPDDKPPGIRRTFGAGGEYRGDRNTEGKGKERPGPASEPHPARIVQAAEPDDMAAPTIASPEPAVATEALPGLANGWNSRANITRVEARIRRDMVGKGPLDPKASPIAKLEAEGFDLENEIVPAILDIEASPGKPIRSWVIYATRARERILAQRRLNEPRPELVVGIPEGTEIITLGHLGDFAEPVLRRYLEAWRESPSCWFAFLGPKPGEPGCLIPARLLEMVEAA